MKLNIFIMFAIIVKIKINIFINWYFVWLMIFLKKIIQKILIIGKIIIINKKQINLLLYNLLFYNHIQFFLIICNYIDKKAIYWAKK